MLRTCRDFIHLGYECKIVAGLIEFQARESSFSKMRDESVILFVYVNRIWHTISMRLEFKQNNINVNFCEIMEIVSENSGEIRAESSTSAARSDSQRVALARSTDCAGALSKNDCRQSRPGEMLECIAWVRVEKRTRNFNEIAKSIGHSRHYDFHRYNRLS